MLDTLGKVMPEARVGESAYQRDYRIGGRLKRIADEWPGLAVVVVHHDRKAAAEDFVDSVSGTNGLAGHRRGRGRSNDARMCTSSGNTLGNTCTGNIEEQPE